MVLKHQNQIVPSESFEYVVSAYKATSRFHPCFECIVPLCAQSSHILYRVCELFCICIEP